MEKLEKKIILIICILIIILVAILWFLLNKTPKYDKELYDEIYSEYNEIFEGNEDPNVVMQNIDGKEYRVIGKLTIPKMNVNSPIINETTDELLKIAPTKYAGPNPNEVGNLCIIGHNYKNDQFFSNLSTLDIDDEIILTANNGTEKVYKVYEKFEVVETDLSDTSQETNGQIELTLITCTKSRAYRLIVKCRSV